MPGLLPLTLGLALLAGCSASAAGGPDAPVPDRASRRAALRGAPTFAAVLSERAEADALDDYPVVILDPDAYEAADLTELRGRGVLALGYVNVGEVEAWRSFADRVEPEWVLGENPHWPGHRFVDAREEGWRSLVVDVAAARVAAREFDGLFLDMADVAAPGVHPETREGVVALIRALREAYPTHVIVMNRGLFLVDEVGEDLDGLLVEGVWSRYHHDQQAYAPAPEAEREALLDALLDFRERFGGAALVIDYADTSALRAAAEAGGRRAGIPVFVSTLDLAHTDLAPDDAP